VCLILFAWQAHPRYPLIVAANREEFHQRPTTAAAFWKETPDLLAGRDLQAGGTWLGVTRSGRFAAITNYREPLAPDNHVEMSRGHLVRDFLLGQEYPMHHASTVSERGSSYSGFNLLLGTPGELAYVSNRNEGPVTVQAGSHGLSNHLLDTDWPKVHAGREHLESLLDSNRIDPEQLLELLTDRSLTPGDIPENIEDDLVPELLTRHYFIISPVYGTRSSTVVLVDNNGETVFVERQFDPHGQEIETRSFQLP
jgi:uncharacterized protein with NRDE domain